MVEVGWERWSLVALPTGRVLVLMDEFGRGKDELGIVWWRG